MDKELSRYEMIVSAMTVLEENKGSRVNAARILGTSRRHLANLIKEANKKYNMGIVEIISNKHISGDKAFNRIFPTNKERLKHLDRRRA